MICILLYKMLSTFYGYIFGNETKVNNDSLQDTQVSLENLYENYLTDENLKINLLNHNFDKKKLISFLCTNKISVKRLVFIEKFGLTIDDLKEVNNYILIFNARYNYNPDVFEYLISKGLSFNDFTADNNAIFIMACSYNRLNVVKYLISLGLTIEDIRSDNNKALMLASKHGHLETVKYLLETEFFDKNGNLCKLTFEDVKTDNFRALTEALNHNHLNVARFMLEHEYYFGKGFTDKLKLFDFSNDVKENAIKVIKDTMKNSKFNDILYLKNFYSL